MSNYCQQCGGVTVARKARLCKPCDIERRRSDISREEYRRGWQLKKKYNLDLQEFDALWNAFKGRCGICNTELIMPTRTRGQPANAVAVDHDHKTGRLRGLLCNACNKGLGLFRDSKDNLVKAIRWLEYSDEKIGND